MIRKFIILVAVNLVWISGMVFAVEPDCDRFFLEAVKADDLEDAGIHLRHDSENVNIKDRVTGETALIIAAKNRSTAMMRLLLDVANINVNQQDSRTEETALIIVAKNRDAGMMRLLLDVATVDVNLVGNDDMTALLYCIKGHFNSGINLLLRKNSLAVNYQSARRRETALHIAVESDNTEAVSLLLGNPFINTDLKNLGGKTAFMIAVEEQNLEMLRLFRNVSQFDINRQDVEGVPPLLFAIENNYPLVIIEELLRFRGAIYSKDRDGHDAFAFQERYAWNNTGLRKMLEEEMERGSSW